MIDKPACLAKALSLYRVFGSDAVNEYWDDLSAGQKASVDLWLIYKRHDLYDQIKWTAPTVRFHRLIRALDEEDDI